VVGGKEKKTHLRSRTGIQKIKLQILE
jgi:hypothetical protein